MRLFGRAAPERPVHRVPVLRRRHGLRASEPRRDHARRGRFDAVALAEGTRPVVVPRLRRFREAVDDHQLHLARRLAEAGSVRLVENPVLLREALDDTDEPAPAPLERPGLIVEDLRGYLDAALRRRSMTVSEAALPGLRGRVLSGSGVEGGIAGRPAALARGRRRHPRAPARTGRLRARGDGAGLLEPHPDLRRSRARRRPCATSLAHGIGPIDDLLDQRRHGHDADGDRRGRLLADCGLLRGADGAAADGRALVELPDHGSRRNPVGAPIQGEWRSARSRYGRWRARLPAPSSGLRWHCADTAPGRSSRSRSPSRRSRRRSSGDIPRGGRG